jgi:hypothetical protein
MKLVTVGPGLLELALPPAIPLIGVRPLYPKDMSIQIFAEHILVLPNTSMSPFPDMCFPTIGDICMPRFFERSRISVVP